MTTQDQGRSSTECSCTKTTDDVTRNPVLYIEMSLECYPVSSIPGCPPTLSWPGASISHTNTHTLTLQGWYRAHTFIILILPAFESINNKHLFIYERRVAIHVVGYYN